MNWLYRFVIYLFVNAGRVTLNDEAMDAGASYRDNLNSVRESLEYALITDENESDIEPLNTSMSFYSEKQVCNDNNFIGYLLKHLERLMHQITDLPEKHRARLRFSSD